jgi:hypothetical protein
MSKLTELFKNPEDQRKGPNCGVTALAVTTGVSFNKAWQTFKAVNPGKYGKRWKGGTYTGDQIKALDRLKVSYETVNTGGLLDPKITLAKFVREHTKRDCVYMVTTTTHVQAVLNGEVIDQAGKKPIGNFWGSRKIVKRAHLIKEPFKHATAPKAAQPAPGAPALLFPATELPSSLFCEPHQLTLF